MRTSLIYRTITLVGAICLYLMAADSVSAATYYVATTGSDSSPGTPDQPFETIRKALDTAQSGDTVLVGNGDYTGPGNSNLDFGGKNIVLRAQQGVGTCRILPNFSRAFSFHSGETAAAVVDGFNISGGFAPVYGSGIFVSGSSPTIRNCRFASMESAFHSNSTGDGGGGIAVENGSPQILNCQFERCRSTGRSGKGGGIYVLSGSPRIQFCGFRDGFGEGGGICLDSGSAAIEDCTFDANLSSDQGGGVCVLGGSPAIQRCTFLNNACSSLNGGGACYITNTTLTFYACVFSGGNHAPLGGAAVVSTGSNVTFRDCRFSGNQATFSQDNNTYGGGAINSNGNAVLTAVNCLFQNNTANEGGAIHFQGASSGTIRNCTFAGNAARNSGGAIYVGGFLSSPTVSAANCIFWGNVNGGLFREEGSLTVTYSDVQGGFSGLGNINTDPRFVRNPSSGTDGQWGSADDDYGDLHLQAGSLAINAGTVSTPNLPFFDLAGNARIAGTAPDMGAYEFAASPFALYVDKATGSNANPGTPTAPLQTVSAALAKLTDPYGTAVIFIKASNYGSDRPRVTQKVRFINWGNAGQARIGKP